MNDGPYRTLKLSEHWRRLAELLEHPGFDIGESMQLTEYALHKDLKTMGFNELSSKFSRIRNSIDWSTDIRQLIAQFDNEHVKNNLQNVLDGCAPKFDKNPNVEIRKFVSKFVSVAFDSCCDTFRTHYVEREDVETVIATRAIEGMAAISIEFDKRHLAQKICADSLDGMFRSNEPTRNERLYGELRRSLVAFAMLSQIRVGNLPQTLQMQTQQSANCLHSGHTKLLENLQNSIYRHEYALQGFIGLLGRISCVRSLFNSILRRLSI